jgi:6-phosphofructo-2-kinase / fructose-2,6-biphosphatase 2
VEDMLNWFKDRRNKVAILDATNSTKSRRKWIHDKIQAHGELLRKALSPSVLSSPLILSTDLFVESKCDDENLIMQNILDVKTTSPDYVG